MRRRVGILGACLVVARGYVCPTRSRKPVVVVGFAADATPGYGLYEVQEEMLVKRGALEETLMLNSSPLQAQTPKGVGKKGGFGASSSSSSSSLKQETKLYTKILKKDGVVRIDHVLSPKLADNLRAFVFELRKNSEESVRAGSVRQQERFADVLLRSNRCDLKLPIGPSPVNEALQNIFSQTAVRSTIETMLSARAVLYELSCLISDPGSQRQVVHSDNPLREGLDEPTMLTCFVALQDIDLSMGPTVWLPRTHTATAHEQFHDETVGPDGAESPKDTLLRSQKAVLGTLSKGSCAIYDSRVLHCGSANKSRSSRALFYFSFRNPKVAYPGNPASIRDKIGQVEVTISSLADALKSFVAKGELSPLLLTLYEDE